MLIEHGPFEFGQLIRAHDRSGGFVEGRIIEELAIVDGRMPVIIVAPDRIVLGGKEQPFFPGGLVFVPYFVEDDFDGRIEFVLTQSYVWGLLTTLIAETEGESAALAVMDDNDEADDDFLDGCDDMHWHLESLARVQEVVRRMLADER